MSAFVLCIHATGIDDPDRVGCALELFGGRPHATRDCVGCASRTQPAVRLVPVRVNAVAAVPPARWPLAARTVARLARDGEAGVGDTLARLIGNVQGDRMARWYERITGKDCGCGDRQGRLNARYPYT